MKCIDIPLYGYFCYLRFYNEILILHTDKRKLNNTVKGIMLLNIKKIEKYLFLKNLEKDSYKVKNNDRIINYVPIDTKKKLLDFLELLEAGYGEISYREENKNLEYLIISKERFIELYAGICNI